MRNPSWYSAKYGAFADIEGGIPDVPEGDEWDADADGTPDGYFLVQQPIDIEEMLAQAFNLVAEIAGSGSSVAVTSPRFREGSLAFQTEFDPKTNTGDLKAYRFSDGSLEGDVGASGCNSLPRGNICEEPIWNAAALMNPSEFASRQIVTLRPGNESTGDVGVPFRWASLSTAQRDLFENHTGVHPGGLAGYRLDWLRGDTQFEGENTDDFRVRPSIVTDTGVTKAHILGEIINTAPLYVNRPTQYMPDEFFTSSTGNSVSYSTFQAAQANRTPMVYVGANDGMLHGFVGTECDGENGNLSCGQEKFAYIPHALLERSLQLADKGYSRQSFFDGQFVTSDVLFSDNTWHTILVGTLGMGRADQVSGDSLGGTVFALDITNPDLLTEENASDIVLWEYTDPNLGVLQSAPRITRLNDNGDAPSNLWGVILGNGYNGRGFADDQVGYLTVLNMETGAVIKKIATDVMADGGGLSELALADIDRDFETDYVYAGDLEGRLWKFDLRNDVAPASWDVAYFDGATPIPAFVAERCVDKCDDASSSNDDLSLIHI